MTLEPEKYTEDNRDREILAENCRQKFTVEDERYMFYFLEGKRKD